MTEEEYFEEYYKKRNKKLKRKIKYRYINRFAFGGTTRVLESTVENFPFLANSLLWHQDDVTNDTAPDWTDRFGGVIVSAPFGANWLKDADGVHREIGASIGYSGALPDPTLKHIVAINVEKCGNTGSGQAYYDLDRSGTSGFIRTLTQDVAAPTSYFAGVNTTNYLTFAPPSSTQFDQVTAASLNYANYTAADGAGSISWRAGKVAGVNTSVSLTPTLTGDMTTALNPAGNPLDEIGFNNSTTQEIRTKMFGLLVFSSAPPDLQAAAEFMRDHPGYLPIQWAGLT